MHGSTIGLAFALPAGGGGAGEVGAVASVAGFPSAFFGGSAEMPANVRNFSMASSWRRFLLRSSQRAIPIGDGDQPIASDLREARFCR
jgi:hypothetical protein